MLQFLCLGKFARSCLTKCAGKFWNVWEGLLHKTNTMSVFIKVSRRFGMTGIVVKQNGPPGKKFIHLDNLGNDYTKLTGGPRPWLWSYT